MGWLETTGCLIQCNVMGAIEVLQNMMINMSACLHPRARDPSRLLAASMDHRNLQGRVCIVTGGNAGIGLETSKLLAACGVRVVVACRSATKGLDTLEILREVKAHANCQKEQPRFIRLDLEDKSSVHEFVKAFKASKLPLDMLICNAGIMAPPSRCVASNNVELQFQVNHLGHWLLAHELLKVQLERQNRKGAGTCSPRIVFLTSLTHWGGRKLFPDPYALGGYNPLLTYGDSKLGNLLTVKELQRRFDRNSKPHQNGYSAVAVHPGLLHTELACTWMENNFPAFMRPTAKYFLRNCGLHTWWTLPVVCGADAVFFAAAAPAKQVAGRYLAYGKPGWQSSKGDNAQTGQYLWNLSCSLTDTETCKDLL